MMIYYLPILIIAFGSFFLFRRVENKLLMLLWIFDTVLTGVFVYSILLGLYFKNYYMGEFDGTYPSVYISRWVTLALFTVGIPANLLIFMMFVISKLKRKS
jgi:hypothetical protein